MAFDDSDPFEQPPSPSPSPLDERLKPRQLLWDCIVSPGTALARVAERPGWRRWIWPLGLLTLLSLGVFALQTPARNRVSAAALEAKMAEVQAQMGGDAVVAGQAMPAAGGIAGSMNLVAAITGAIGIPLGILLGTLLVAGVLHFVGTVLGGQQGFGAVFTAAAWAKTPLILGAVLKLGAAAAGNFDYSPAGLSGLVAADPLAEKTSQSYLGPLLGQVELWNLWYLGLLVVLMMVVSKISRGRALAAVGLLLLLRVLSGVAGAALANMVGGLGG